MTTIAWDGHNIAADSRSNCGEYTNPLDFVKLLVKCGIVFGLSGTPGMLDVCADWFLEGAKPRTMPEIKHPDGFSFMVFRIGEPALYFHHMVPYGYAAGAPDAWGSGGDFAIGAMLWGADAFQALEVACIANAGKTAPPIYGYTSRDGVWVSA